MGNDDDIFSLGCHYLVKKWLQSIPFVSSAFCIGKKTIINCFFVAFKVFAQPLHGFSAASSEVALPQFRFYDWNNL